MPTAPGLCVHYWVVKDGLNEGVNFTGWVCKYFGLFLILLFFIALMGKQLFPGSCAMSRYLVFIRTDNKVYFQRCYVGMSQFSVLRNASLEFIGKLTVVRAQIAGWLRVCCSIKRGAETGLAVTWKTGPRQISQCIV